MHRQRAIVLLSSVTVVIVATAAWLTIEPPPVEAAAQGRFQYDGGFVGYSFVVTNKSTQSMDVMVARRGRSTPPDGYASRTQTTMQPRATWNAAVYPPAVGVAWSADVLYQVPPGKTEVRLRALGARLGMCKKAESRWKRAQRIEIRP